MKISITGSTGLFEELENITSYRVDDLLETGRAFEEALTSDVFINYANHSQLELMELFYNEWQEDDTKMIINISSRAAQPNISVGKLYAARKAALNHYSNNAVYNDKLKQCRITTINLGMMESEELPSLKWKEVALFLNWYWKLPYHIEIPELTLQNSENYRRVQDDKEMLKDAMHLVNSWQNSLRK